MHPEETSRGAANLLIRQLSIAIENDKTLFTKFNLLTENVIFYTLFELVPDFTNK